MKKNYQVSALGFLLLAACSSKEPAKKPIIYPDESPEVSTTKPKETSVTAKQLATEQGSNFVTEFKFEKGSSTVTKQQQQEIRETYEKAKKLGIVKEAQLVTWTDQEFPVKEKKELDSAQKNLVEKRNENLEKYIKTLDKKVSVKKISMAERASAFERFTSTKEAEVKESLQTQDAPGKTGESIVVFLLKKD